MIICECFVVSFLPCYDSIPHALSIVLILKLYLLCSTDNLAVWFSLFFRGFPITMLINYHLVLSSPFSPISNSIASCLQVYMITLIRVYADLSACKLMVIPLQYTARLPVVVKLLSLIQH